MLPAVITLTAAHVADSRAALAAVAALPPHCFVIMDRGYNDYEFFHQLTQRGTGFITRLKEKAVVQKTSPAQHLAGQKYCCSYRVNLVSKTGQQACGQQEFLVVEGYDPNWTATARDPEDNEGDGWFQFITNDLTLTAEEVIALYKRRWDIERFFKKLKQNMVINSFLGTSANAVQCQIWTAALATLLLEMMRQQSLIPIRFALLKYFVLVQLLSYSDFQDWLLHGFPGRKTPAIRDKPPLQLLLDLDGGLLLPERKPPLNKSEN